MPKLHASGHTLNRRSAIRNVTGMAIGAAVASSALPISPLSVSLAHAESTQSDQWWGWRGPTGNNHASASAKMPASISLANVAWSIKIPGRGHSSPIVVDDAIYLTTADKSAGTQSVLAVSRSGKGLWQTTVHQGGIPAINHSNNTEASPTLAYNGHALFASFYSNNAIQLTRLTTAGKIVWQKDAGRYAPKKYKYGYAASPLIYQDKVILNADFDGAAFLTALDSDSGKVIWKIKRPGTTSFSSPICTSIAGRDQLLLSGGEMVAGYDPNDGKLLWKSEGATTMATCGTMVWDGDLVFASGGYPKSETVCISASGQNAGEIIWSNRTKCYEQSMLVRDGFVYAIADSGVAYCWRGSDGKTMWRERLGGKYSSSPLLVGDTVTVFSENGDVFSFAASPDRYQAVGQSKLGNEAFASPVVIGDTMYSRIAKREGARQEYLLALK